MSVSTSQCFLRLKVGQLKCSGEKTGCKRCRDLDHQCTYSESRVGKNPGNRGKRRNGMMDPATLMRSSTTTPIQSNPFHHPSAYHFYNPAPPPTISTATDQSPAFESTGYAHSAYVENAFSASTPSSDFNMNYGLGLELPVGATPPSSVDSEPLIRCSSMETSPVLMRCSSMETSPAPPLMPHGSEAFVNRLSASPYAQPGYFPTYDQQAPHPPTSAPATPSGETSSALSACTQLVQYLDTSHNTPSSSSVEDAVGAARTATADVARLLRLPACRASGSCLLLLSVALGQVVALFEAGVGGLSPGSLPMGGAGGGYETDSDPRAVLRGCVLGRELRRAAQVLDVLQAALSDPVVGATLPIIPAPWAAEMRARLETMSLAVEGPGWR